MRRVSVGRIVHLTRPGEAGRLEVFAAIVTRVEDEVRGIVTLTVFTLQGPVVRPSVYPTIESAGADLANGKWSWPEVVT